MNLDTYKKGGKVKQKQKQSQSTNINIRIGETRKRRAKKSRPRGLQPSGFSQKRENVSQNSQPPPSGPRVITQLVSAPSAPSSATGLPSSNASNIQNSLIDLLRETLSKQPTLNEIATPNTLPTATPVHQNSSSSSSSSSTPMGPLKDELKISSSPLSAHDPSVASQAASSAPDMQLPPAQGMPAQPAQPAQEGKYDEADNEEEDGPQPGESLVQTGQPALIIDLASVGKPIYDTGFDFHYKRHGQNMIDRVYLNFKNTGFFWDGNTFNNIHTYLGGKLGKSLKTLLQDRNISYNVDEQNQINWLGDD